MKRQTAVTTYCSSKLFAFAWQTCYTFENINILSPRGGGYKMEYYHTVLSLFIVIYSIIDSLMIIINTRVV